VGKHTQRSGKNNHKKPFSKEEHLTAEEMSDPSLWEV